MLSLIKKSSTVYMHRIEELLANCISANNSNGSLPSGATREKITHVVLSGENLYTIANRYGVTAKDIRKWNGLGSNRVAKGKRLRLYVDNGGVAFASAAKTPVKSTATTTKKSASVATKQIASANKDFVSYKVKSGDSLYSISKKYPGVTASSLQKVNGLSSPDIRPGQVLKIPVG